MRNIAFSIFLKGIIMKKILLLISMILSFAAANSHATDIVPVDGGTFTYQFTFYGEGENFSTNPEDPAYSTADITDDLRTPLYASAQYWASVIKAAGSPTVTFKIAGYDDHNASALSFHSEVEGSDYLRTNVNIRLNNLTAVDPDEELGADGLIFIGPGIGFQNAGWAPFTGYHSLYHGDIADLNAIMAHEIMHALGITTGAQQYEDGQSYFSTDDDPITIFDKDLRIYTGDMEEPFDPLLEIQPEPNMTIGDGEEFDIVNYAPYYVGEETLKVLANEADYDDARAAIEANGGFTNYSIEYVERDRFNRPKVYGMPIHPYDDMEENGPDLAHLDLRNSYMSHQNYRNWLVPMEAELAVLKDIGYNVDLRKHFGQSYYLSNQSYTFDTGYSKWNGTAYTGEPSDAIQGVGLHIYGDNNTVTQASDIKTAGDGSFGVRIEGINNAYTLKTGNSINADGKENIALAATWGMGHTITLQSGSEITADGEDGIAASFDFGGNMFGTQLDLRGSYIYKNTFGMTEIPETDTQGALVENFNIAGTLQGGKAIYISGNAHVKNINILAGAEINGDIISDWNSVSYAGNAYVQHYDEINLEWTDVNQYDESQIYFTNLNINSGFDGTINGSIDGGNGIYNTLILNSSGTVALAGDTLNVNRMFNSGSFSVGNANITLQNGNITGNGTISASGELSLESASDIENTISLESTAELSTINDEIEEISINKLNTDNASISFDIGDTLNLLNDSDASLGSATIMQVKATQEEISIIADGDLLELFKSGGSILDLGASSANLYYDGKRYTFAQSGTDGHYINVSVLETPMELGDAAEDPTTANYIVTEDRLTRSAGTVHGDEFEISGKDIDANGYSGLVINGTYNPDGTTLETGMHGASGSNITINNAGQLFVNSEDKEISLGRSGETAISLNGGTANLDSEQNAIKVLGSIAGTSNASDFVNTDGNAVMLSNISKVSATLAANYTKLNGTAQNVKFAMGNGLFGIAKDEYLSSDGTNEITVNDGAISLANGTGSDIHLAKMTLNKNLDIAIDADLKAMSADKFVFQNSADLDTNGYAMNIAAVNVANVNAKLTAERYEMPVAGAEYHNEALAGAITADFEARTINTPIFKYDMSFEHDDDSAEFVLERGSADNYENYNPAVLAAPVSALLGGNSALANSYEQSFTGLDALFDELSNSSDINAEETIENLAEENLKEKGDTIENENAARQTEKPAAVKKAKNQLRVYSSFGKAPLKNGPEADFRLYGTDVFLAASDKQELAHGWEGIAGYRTAFNMASQKFSGNTVYQPGAMFGISGMAYKDGISAGLSANLGLSQSNIETPAGSEDFAMIMAGLAAKTGYTHKISSRMSAQANMLMSYSLTNAFEYTNAYGVRINPDPLHAFNVQPEIKLSYAPSESWKINAGAARAFNYLGETKFNAEKIKLPDFAVKAYSKFSLGINKEWDSKCTGSLNGYITEGGLKSGGIQAGYACPFGGKSKK